MGRLIAAPLTYITVTSNEINYIFCVINNEALETYKKKTRKVSVLKINVAINHISTSVINITYRVFIIFIRG